MRSASAFFIFVRSPILNVRHTNASKKPRPHKLLKKLVQNFIRSLTGRTSLPQRLNKYHGVQKDAEHGRYHADGKPGDGEAFAPLKALLNL